MYSTGFRDLLVGHIPQRYEADAHEHMQHKKKIWKLSETQFYYSTH